MKNLSIALLISLATPIAFGASFDCAKASTKIEKTICADGTLSDLDTQLMQAYKNAVADTASVDVVKKEQREWLSQIRNRCEDEACLRDAYNTRIAALHPAASVVAPPAPKTEAVAIPAPQPEATPKPISENTDKAPAPSPVSADTSASAPTPVATPAPVAAPEPVVQKQAAKPPVAAPAVATPETTPPPGIVSQAFMVLLLVFLLVLVVGLVKPSWVIRWVKEPSRKHVLGYVGAALIACNLASQATETKEYTAYHKIEEDKRKAADAAKDFAKQRTEAIAHQRKMLEDSARERLNEFSLASQGGACDQVLDVTVVNKRIGHMDNARPGGQGGDGLPAGAFQFQYVCVNRSMGRKDVSNLFVSVAYDREFSMYRCVLKATNYLRPQFEAGLENCGFKQDI